MIIRNESFQMIIIIFKKLSDFKYGRLQKGLEVKNLKEFSPNYFAGRISI